MLRRCLCAVLATVAGVSGCGWWEENEQEDIDESFRKLVTANQTPKPAETSRPMSSLKVGDRFPLIKTVEQSLTQHSAQDLLTGWSKLELLLTIAVKEIRNERSLLSVRYRRVRYSQNVGGEKVEFDSSRPQHPLPTAFLAYQGLIGNGFSFWIGSNNQIIETVGFDEFLKRCQQNVAFEDQQAERTPLASQSEADIARFLDESIGLLPFEFNGSRLEVGQAWTKKQIIQQPVPMNLSTTYKLTALNDKSADVEILGTMAPADTFRRESQSGLTLRRGHSVGRATIDRTTGLPIKSRVERHFEMLAHLADGSELVQRKKTVTTIHALSGQDADAMPARANVLQSDSSTETAYDRANIPVNFRSED